LGDQDQSVVFVQLEQEMQQTSSVYFKMALADALITAIDAYHGKIRVNGIADAFNYFTVATFIYFGSFEFRAIYATAGMAPCHPTPSSLLCTYVAHGGPM
jgi:hypothetical protein